MTVITAGREVHSQAKATDAERITPICEVIIEGVHAEDVVPSEEQDYVHDQENASDDVAPRGTLLISFLFVLKDAQVLEHLRLVNLEDHSNSFLISLVSVRFLISL